ncbi:MAG: DUF1801 domain-containing protein [Pseudomonadota bacterium]
MSELFRLSGAVSHMLEIDEWLSSEPHALFAIARLWFGKFRQCGSDVKELLHDGGAVACVDDAAFGYVNVFKSHVNVGFFTGAFLDDPHQLLDGTGKRMRHVKIKPGSDINSRALEELINRAYLDIKARL